MFWKKDILRKLSIDDLYKLRAVYKQQLPYTTHVYSFLNTAIDWRKRKPNKNYINVFAKEGNSLDDGTFISLMQFSCYDLFMHTLEKDGKPLYNILKQTKKIDFNKHIMMYALHHNHKSDIMQFLKEGNIKTWYELNADFWCMPKKKALNLKIDCPQEYYIDTLKPYHASIIDRVWQHNWSGSVNYVKTFIEMNGGIGAFKKSDDSLASWCLVTHNGSLSVLQTAKEHREKGLAIAVIRALGKKIAQIGNDPVGEVMKTDIASQKMFEKAGYEKTDSCTFLGVGKEQIPSNYVTN